MIDFLEIIAAKSLRFVCITVKEITAGCNFDADSVMDLVIRTGVPNQPPNVLESAVAG